ncbi:MAG: kynureninase [Brevefilum sp.]
MEKLLTNLKIEAEQLDHNDPLRSNKSLFKHADPDQLYMDGNSLGRLPLTTQDVIQDVIDTQWGEDLIRSWGDHWYDAPTRLGEKLCSIIGAQPGEVVIADSTTINLFKLIVSALRLRPDRKRVISDVLNFPTDLYTIGGALDLIGEGHELVLLPSEDEIHIDLNDYAAQLNEDTAVVTFSTPTFKSGFLHDVPLMTKMAHDVGALVVWDFSHAVGAVPLDVTSWEVDFAVGCTYKYLNGGPGSPAFLYVNHQLLASVENQPVGWWGHQSPFSFDLDYTSAESIRKTLVGTPPILSMMTLDPAIDIVEKAGINTIREKSIKLTDFFIRAFDEMLAEKGYALGSPRKSERRGSHVSIKHPESYRICQALMNDLNVIPDFREPDNIRLGFSPLYTSFMDIFNLVERLACVVDEGIYKKYSLERSKVT